MNVQLINPLLSRKPLPISNWKEWLTHWENTTSLQEMLGLLHFGFDVETWSSQNEYTWKDRVLFYLSVADGWSDDMYLYVPDEDRECRYEIGRDKYGNGIQKTVRGLRQDVATKAASLVFKELNQIPVAVSGKYGPEPNSAWESIFASDFFPYIQSFFRITERSEFSNPEVRNLTAGYVSRYHILQGSLIQFITNLADAMWGWKEPSYFNNDQQKEKAEALRARIEEAKPWMVEVLCRCGKVAKLEEWLLSFDEKCLEVIKNIALERGVGDKQSQSVEEACYQGSKTAWLLIRHRILSQEAKRQKEVQEMAWRLQEEEQRKRALEQAEADAAAAQQRLAALKQE